ncbi:helix-turn-helix transcriptional regulator [Paenibacillus lignilyticus]|uniref:AraC family transcriptional regulator n=1 Tax=Paenibacillus lignilyticus TaxID=1172615 RepID=A0ABS5CFX8_9BACL|nr:helix-turn-helix domain-containing protein [Paenibacillus lignilyticus]MBP3964717.1 AraC family transcriptional regulator [Paenibacillus lignilyticus]
MKNNHPWLPLIEKASLHMLEHDLHRRTELRQVNRKLPFYIASYIKEGSCRLHIAGRDYFAGPGDVVLIPPYELHDHVKDTNEETEFLWWHFTLQVAGCIDALQAFRFPVIFRLPKPEQFESVFHEYSRIAGGMSSLSGSLMKKAKALELVAILIDAAIHHPDVLLKAEHSDPFMSMMTELLDNPDRRIDLAELGKRYYMHPTYIAERFKKLFGITPTRLQLQLRLRRAKQLLETESRPITEIARLTGYEDIDDFSRFFKSKTGLSPLKYRTSRLAGGGGSQFN